MADLKEKEEKSWFGVFYHPFTTPSLPPQPPQNAILGIYQSNFMKICVEDDVKQIWRKMKRNSDLECFITLCHHYPAYYPKMLTLEFFDSIFMEISMENNIRQMRKNEEKSCFVVFYHPSSPHKLPQNANNQFQNPKNFQTAFIFMQNSKLTLLSLFFSKQRNKLISSFEKKKAKKPKFIFWVGLGGDKTLQKEFLFILLFCPRLSSMPIFIKIE